MSSCNGSIGKKGRRMAEPRTLNMFPKLELSVIFKYFMILMKVFLPSFTPSTRTMRLFSSRMMSADSFAMSTAVSTEMPTSASCIAEASLTPSPKKPTVSPFDLRALMMRDFCNGETLAKVVVFWAADMSS